MDDDGQRTDSDEDDDEDLRGLFSYYLIFYTFHLVSTDFINDDDLANDSRSHPFPSLTIADPQEIAFETLLERLDERLRLRRQSTRRRQIRTPIDDEAHTDALVKRLPGTSDYPLWRVRCRVILLLIIDEKLFSYIS